MKKSDELIYADLFCGGGGFSEGARRAAIKRGLKVSGVAVNHWNLAIATHQTNHPHLNHLCANLDSVDPIALVPGRHLDLLLASPECTHHSRARGGKPKNDQLRASAYNILKWADLLDIDNILIENVAEFVNWGRLDPRTGQPLKSEKGRLFEGFIHSLELLGYAVEWRVLCAADYGAAQSRERLFIQCRKGRRKPVWKLPTHQKNADVQPYLLESRKPWRSFKEIMEKDKKGKSISLRKKPLKPTTMARIMKGMRKFNGLEFVMNISHTKGNGGYITGLDKSLPTLTTRQEHMLVQPNMIPFVLQIRGGSDGYMRGTSENESLGTITADPAMMVVQPELQPFIIGMGGNGGSAKPRKASMPLNTITPDQRYAYVDPKLVPFLLGQQSGAVARSGDDSMPTLSAAGAVQVIEGEKFLIQFHGGKGAENRSKSVNEPLDTIDTNPRFALNEPFIIKYYGSEKDGQSIHESLSTLTSIAHHALVFPVFKDREGQLYLVDIRTRMITIREAARGQGFDDPYRFIGTTKEQMKQIGNAVEVNMAEALVDEILLDELLTKELRRKKVEA